MNKLDLKETINGVHICAYNCRVDSGERGYVVEATVVGSQVKYRDFYHTYENAVAKFTHVCEVLRQNREMSVLPLANEWWLKGVVEEPCNLLLGVPR